MVVLKSLVSGQHSIGNQPNSFELLGYDVMIDSNLQCWLIEINTSPSLHKEHLIDEIIKQTLVDDIIDLVNPLDIDHERFMDVLARRIAEGQGFKSKIKTHNNTQETLNRDLTYFLRGQKPRLVGEAPAKPGAFEMIAPSDLSTKVEAYARLGRK